MNHSAVIGGTVCEISSGKACIDGTVYEINSGKTTIGGTNHDIEFGEPLPIGTEIVLDSQNYQLDILNDWVCPATGNWQLEIHGGGGSGGAAISVPSTVLQNQSYKGAKGGGSGNVYSSIPLSKNQTCQFIIGSGGVYQESMTTEGFYSISNPGENSIFFPNGTNNVSYGISGGGAPSNGKGGALKGNIASSGADEGNYNLAALISYTWSGLGVDQRLMQEYLTGSNGNYGNGGAGDNYTFTSINKPPSRTLPSNGSDGAIILTYLGA